VGDEDGVVPPPPWAAVFVLPDSAPRQRATVAKTDATDARSFATQ
jgi:hypothetical protein